MSSIFSRSRKPVKERSQRAEVHAERSVEQKVRVYALKLVHDSADDLHAVRHLDAESFFYAVAQCVAVHMRRKVVQTVGKGQCLGIRFGFAKFFYTTVYIAAVYVYLLYYLAVQRYAGNEAHRA